MEIEGVSREMRRAIEESSALVLNRTRDPKSLPGLEYRARSDEGRILDVLHSHGYYSAEVEMVIAEGRVVVQIDPGPLYTLVSFDVEGADIEPQITLGGPAAAGRILKEQGAIMQRLEDRGYMLAQLEDQQVTVDQAAKSVAVTLEIDPGPLCHFGNLYVVGLEKVKRRFVTQCLGWRKGQVYDMCKVDRTVRYLRRSGLFRSISITHAPEAGPDGSLDITITLEEREARTIGIGGSYNIDQGIGPEIEWEHRNLFGMGEDLGVRASGGDRKQEILTYFRKPHFLRCDQDLLLSLEGRHENRPAYRSTAVEGSALIDRVYNERWGWSYGVQAEQLSTKRSNNDGDFSLLMAPMTLRYLNVDDLLDPHWGFRARYELFPTMNFVEKSEADKKGTRYFLKQRVYAALYLPLGRPFTLAFWGTWGSILGQSDVAIPAPHRFYAGSDLYLRGYKYQSVGPLGADGKPIGGRSIMLYGTELRIRLSKSWGWAFFYEFGNVYEQEWPQFDSKMLNSVGMGPRYYTAIGPLSLDIAVPLNRRPGLDRAFQVYINIGQPF